MSASARQTLKVEVPRAFDFLFRPAPYKVAYGGRGSGKSWNFARALILLAYQSPLRILCTREIQNSIDESVHHLLAEQVGLMGLEDWFTVRDKYIESRTGSAFLFAGLRSNVTKLKSMEALNYVWVEEAENISNDSWEKLIPTMFRREPSEILVTFNPRAIRDPTYQRFVLNPPPGAIVRKVSWRDNPYFSEGQRREKDYLARVDPAAYAHVWEGECTAQNDAQIFRDKYVIEAFEPGKDWDGPYLGADWGFAVDPTTLVRCWIYERTLFIEYEAYAIGRDIHKTGELFDLVPGSRKHTIRADNARPETISYMQQHGFPNVTGVEKWAGSVEDGIAHMRSYERIVVHPRCTHTADEFRLYSYKTDRLTGDVLPEVLDMLNHCIDAIRYALQPLIRNVNTGFLTFMKNEVEAMNARRRPEST